MDDGPARYRSVFISDIHLGTRGCQAELLLDFIRHMDCQSLYLVGDIVDGWKMKSGLYWPQSHNDVIQKILRLARRGVAVTYIPGNHDDLVRDFCGIHFGGVVVARDAIHQCADGRRAQDWARRGVLGQRHSGPKRARTLPVYPAGP